MIRRQILIPKALLLGVALAFLQGSTTDSKDAPLLQYFAAIETPAKSGGQSSPTFTYDPLRPLLSISSVRSMNVDSGTNAVTIQLNDNETKLFAALTKKYNGRLLFCVGGDGTISVGKVTSPTTDGVIEFSDARFTGQMAAYLRRHFGNE